ncbi:MAG TPA: ATP-binding cassette domain-containing protein [Solirubrobacteraceae bacterium]|jgi:ABC-2 type transport system ATP-binding protein|nr:ATP-binding cassette domain-containing protein [Solirubrobacteraceae bacterium]
MTLAIEAEDLRKTYPPAVTALDGVSIAVEAGTIFGLLGPNGAGKSTTVRVLSTLTRPDSGRAHVGGIDVLADPVGVRRAIGVVGQKHGADPEATGRENLVLQGEFYGLTGRELKQRVAQSLERFELTEAAGRQVRTYSGGMQRRIEIAMGLLHRPQVLFLDEPTTGLDPEARVQMWREIERLAAEEQMTILLTTHYLEEADRLASMLAIIDRGKVVARGTPNELKSELHGDAIQVELADADDSRASAALRGVAGLGEVKLDGRVIRARAHNGGAAIPAVLAALDAQGVTAMAVTLARPSLDDVYLRHAGRAFHQTDDTQEEAA